MDNVAIVRNKLGLRSDLMRCLLAEFTATAFLLFAGTSANANYAFGGADCKICVVFGWAFAIGLGAYAAGGISGAHMNPAISFAFYLCGRLSVLKFIMYSVAQTFGAFLGSLTTFFLYYDGINHLDGGIRQTFGPKATIGIFVPWPQEYLSIAGCFVGTSLLSFCVMLLTEPRNKIPPVARPMILSMTIVLVATCVSANTGGEVNPARDLGPKLMAIAVGYGWEVFSPREYKWFLIPIFVPFAGAAFGAWFYYLSLGIHLSDDKEKSDDRMEMNEMSRVPIGKSRISIAK
uniref:Aquaporin n=1 Tax=Elaeophora elaphi TaxID=1147741 RepID=A0A0R3RX47_9BILA